MHKEKRKSEREKDRAPNDEAGHMSCARERLTFLLVLQQTTEYSNVTFSKDDTHAQVEGSAGGADVK